MCQNLFWRLIFLPASVFLFGNIQAQKLSHAGTNISMKYGGIIRLDSTKKDIYLTFTGGDYGDGLGAIWEMLNERKIKANFFFTGDFYRNETNQIYIYKLKKDGHYLGPHSDKHLLYMPWEKRDSLLVSRKSFQDDLLANLEAMKLFKIKGRKTPYFLPPYEWYNDSISLWTREIGMTLINFSPGTGSHADYTTPDMGDRYWSSERILESILHYEEGNTHGLNGFILLMHVGTDEARTDKFYEYLPLLLFKLKERGYRFRRL